MWWIYEAKYRTVSREHFPQRVLKTGVCGGLGATFSSKTIDAHVFFFFSSTLSHFQNHYAYLWIGSHRYLCSESRAQFILRSLWQHRCLTESIRDPDTRTIEHKNHSPTGCKSLCTSIPLILIEWQRTSTPLILMEWSHNDDQIN